MSFLEKYFGKSATELEVRDILNFFKRSQTEGRHLEFKSGEAKIEKVLKEVTAFLNTEGGLLILGAPREADIPGMVKLRSSFGEPEPSKITDSEFVYRKISEGIDPAPKGIFVQQVKFNSGSVFLIDVPASANPPHQLGATGTYYVREEDMSRPGLHTEVEKLFLKKRKADPQLKIMLEREPDSVLLTLNFFNASNVSADGLNFSLQCFPVRDQKDSRLSLEKHRGSFLAKGENWQEQIEILPRETTAYISVRYHCRDVEVRQKSAFVEIGNRQVKVLESFNSEQALFSAEDFFNRHSYLLED